MLFEVAIRLYQFYGNKQILKDSLPYMKRYLKWLYDCVKTGNDRFYLTDWTGCGSCMDNIDFINHAFLLRFNQITAEACRVLGESEEEYQENIKREKEFLSREFIGEDGRCVIDEQTAISILICEGIGNIEVLGRQLIDNIDNKYNGHQHTGMVGIQYLYDALSLAGYPDYVYRILTTDSPSIGQWIRQGATTLYETWENEGHSNSKNHHMYSACLSWFHKYILGIKVNEGYIERIEPSFIKDLDFAKGRFKGRNGEVAVSWKREKERIRVKITLSADNDVCFRDKLLKRGKNVFILEEITN